MKRIIFVTFFFLGATHFLLSQNFGTVVSNLDEPTDLIFVGEDLYYIERFLIGKIDISKAPFTPQIVALGLDRGAGLIVKDNFLYATDFNGGAILKIDISNDNFTAEVLIDGLRTPDMLAIDGDILYFTDPNEQIIGRVSLTNPNSAMSPLIRNAGIAIGIEIYENELFYTDQIEGTVNKVDLTTSFPRAEVVFSDLENPQGMSRCGGEIFVSDDFGNRIWKFSPSCMSSNGLEIEIEGIDTPRQVAFANNFMYAIAMETGDINRFLYESNGCTIDNQVICESDTLTWLDGNIYTTANNTASITLQNSEGCDSIVTLNLTINETAANVTNSNGELMAVETEGTYQWLNCNDGFGTVFGETMSTYTPGFPGFFAVEITKNGCVDTSECIRASVPTNVNDINRDNPFDLYPNPTSEILTIDFDEQFSGKIEVFTLAGQLLDTYAVQNKMFFNFPIKKPSGVYLVRVQLGESTWTERILKN